MGVAVGPAPCNQLQETKQSFGFHSAELFFVS